MGFILRHWPFLALVLMSILDLGKSASVSGRPNEKMYPPVVEDDEASVEDADPQHFFYHSAAGYQSKGYESGSKFESKEVNEGQEVVEGEEEDGEEENELEESIKLNDELVQMFKEMEEDLKDMELIEPEHVPHYWSPPNEGSSGEAPAPGYVEAPGLIPIDLPIKQEFINEILEEPDGSSEDSAAGVECCKCDEDRSIPDGFVYNPTAAGSHNSRSKRSVDDYWYSLGEPNKHLEEQDVYYAIQNDLRKRLKEMSGPLHYGHIYTGNIGDPNDYDERDRAFGPDADFNFPYDTHAFRWKPRGPRLNNLWRKRQYPVYSHNLYKLKDKLKALKFSKDGKGNKATIRGGVYRFVSVTKKGDVLISNVKTREKFFVPRLFFRKKDSVKFQALAPWTDPNGAYFPVYAPLLGGDAYIIKGSPYTGNDPRRGNHLVWHGLREHYPAPPDHFLNPANAMKRPKDVKGALEH